MNGVFIFRPFLFFFWRPGNLLLACTKSEWPQGNNKIVSALKNLLSPSLISREITTNTKGKQKCCCKKRGGGSTDRDHTDNLCNDK